MKNQVPFVKIHDMNNKHSHIYSLVKTCLQHENKNDNFWSSLSPKRKPKTVDDITSVASQTTPNAIFEMRSMNDKHWAYAKKIKR